MPKEWFVKNADIVTVYLYTCQYRFNTDKNCNEYPFDSATIFFKKNENIQNKRLIRKNRIHIKKENNLICEMGLKMRYDTAIQFLKRLHFSPTIDDVDYFTDENGESILTVKEYWDTDIKTFKKCINLSVNQSPQMDDELPF